LLARRVDLRRTYIVLMGCRDGFSGDIHKDYFEALYDTAEEAEAFYNLHRSRTR
jgi:hypothetical protein